MKIKNIEPKVSAGKKVISFDDVFINNDGCMEDENGLVGLQLKPELPENVDTFSFKITLQIPDDVDSDEVDSYDDWQEYGSDGDDSVNVIDE